MEKLYNAWAMSVVEEFVDQKHQYLLDWVIPEEDIDITELDLSTQRLIQAAKEVVPEVALLPECVQQDRKGATIIIASPIQGIPPIAIMVNEISQPDSEFENKPTKHLAYANAKYMTNAGHPEYYGSKLNTIQPEAERDNVNGVDVPAGSISIGGYFVSVSGFNPPAIDEAAAIGIFKRAGLLSAIDAMRYASMIDNREFLSRSATYLGK